jgi:hypothetical protein
MSQKIVIEGGLVRVVNEEIQYSVSMADWLSKIERRIPIETPVLPVGTRAVYWDQTSLENQTLSVLIEVQPQIMRMDFNGDIIELSIPYTRFFFVAKTNDPTNNMAWRLQNYRVFWSHKQYSNKNDRDMIPALLPNVYDDGRICFGSTGANADQSLADRLNQTVNEFFVSRFNRDLVIRRPNRARTWRLWQRMTISNPTGWMEWSDWDPATGEHMRYSYGDLTGNMQDRFEPMVAAEPIAPVPLGASFGRLREWIDTLDNSQRDRLLQAMLTDRALNNERYDTLPEFEEDEDENG